MKRYFKSSPLLFVYIVMLLVVFILPFYSIEGYSILKNTTSQLGAQHTPNSWIMNAVFLFLALTTIYEGIRKFKKDIFLLFMITIFSFSLAMTAFFSHAPISSEIPFNEFFDLLHSRFASSTGFSFTIFAISFAFTQKNIKERVLAVGIGFLATLLSILIFNVPSFAGIWQRGIFITSFAWLIYVFGKSSN